MKDAYDLEKKKCSFLFLVLIKLSLILKFGKKK